jgi:hypothetical protein
MPTVTGSAAISGSGTASLTIYSSWADRPYMIINGTDITDHGRTTKLVLNHVNIKQTNSTRGYQSNFFPRNFNKVKVTSEWEFLPDTSTHTYDGREGRLFLKQLARSKSVVLLYIKNSTQSEYNKFNVVVNSYSEKLIQRRNVSGGVLYKVALELMEL